MSTFQKMQAQVLDYLDDLHNEINALHCLTGLLIGQEPGNNAVNLNELCCLLDPIIERQKTIVDEVRGMFKEVGFTAK